MVSNPFYPISSMSERVFTHDELKRYHGERGQPAYVAYQGVVYDVGDCPKWRSGLHEQLHFAGFDLTSEMPDAPHGREVFTRPCVKRVGVLAPGAGSKTKGL